MFLRKRAFCKIALMATTMLLVSYPATFRVDKGSPVVATYTRRPPQQQEDHGEAPMAALDEMEEREGDVEEREGDVEETEGDVEEREGDVEENWKARRELMESICRELNVTEDIIYTVYQRHYHFFGYNTTVCLVPKVGSSTWRDHIRRVNGGPPANVSVEEDKRRQTFLQSELTQVVAKTVSSSSLIISVRHPLTRLVSAFRNKYDDGRPMRDYNGKHEEEKLKVMFTPRWNEKFHQFWIPAMITNGIFPLDISAKIGLNFTFEPEKLYDPSVYLRIFNLKRPVISFVQFLRHVIATHKNQIPDNHWKTYTSTCSPCTFPYKYVVKMETFQQDMDNVFKTLNIPSKATLARNRIKAGKYKDVNDFKYYTNVPLQIKREIYDIFKMDFEMFGYELPPGFLKGPFV